MARLHRKERALVIVIIAALVLASALLWLSMWLPPFLPGRAEAGIEKDEESDAPLSQGAAEPTVLAPATSTVSAPTPAYPGIYTGTPTPHPAPAGRPNPTDSQAYVIQPGDTLSGIAYAFGCTVEEIATANGVIPDELWPGETLVIPVGASVIGPSLKLIPDSELVYGPAYIHFDVGDFVARQRGYLAVYSEEVEGRSRSGSEIVQLVSQRFSVGPRVLLALLELQAGWVSDANPPAGRLEYPMGREETYREGLFEQLSWAAAELNAGYYGWKYGDWTTVRLSDGSRIGIAPGLNAGTVAVHNFLGQSTWGEEWQQLVGPAGFLAVYERLFGNPFAYTVDPLLPDDLRQPELLLPWPAGEMWYFTGGPHGGWGRGSARAALDFVPSEESGCQPSPAWATAAAAGWVLRSEVGEVVIDLDGDGYEQSGWVLTYLHVHSEGRVEAGVWVERGQRIGHPSCEGGYAEAQHLHFARRYNGEWIPAGDGPAPLVLSGWTAHEAPREYDGTLTREDQVREACECAEDDLNGITSDNTPPQ